jgi:hypothetical protein
MSSERLADFFRKHTLKSAAITEKHEGTRSKTQAACYAMTAGWMIIILGLLVGACSERLSVVAILLFLLGISIAWFGHSYKSKLPDYEQEASDEWREFYESWELLTPAGERLICLGAEFDGRRLFTTYFDGTRDSWPISLLRDSEGAYYRSSPIPGGDIGMLVRLSKCQWRTLSGRVGMVRAAETRYEAESELTLAFFDGTTEKWALSKLEPVTD